VFKKFLVPGTEQLSPLVPMIVLKGESR